MDYSSIEGAIELSAVSAVATYVGIETVNATAVAAVSPHAAILIAAGAAVVAWVKARHLTPTVASAGTPATP